MEAYHKVVERLCVRLGAACYEADNAGRCPSLLVRVRGSVLSTSASCRHVEPADKWGDSRVHIAADIHVALKKDWRLANYQLAARGASFGPVPVSWLF